MEVTIQEAAKVLGVSVYTVRRRIKRRQVPATIDAQGRYVVRLDEPELHRAPAMFATPTLQGRVAGHDPSQGPSQVESPAVGGADRPINQDLNSLINENQALSERLHQAETERDNLAERIDAWREEARAARVAMKQLRHEFLAQPITGHEGTFSQLLGPTSSPAAPPRWGKRHRSAAFALFLITVAGVLAAIVLLLRLAPNPVLH